MNERIKQLAEKARNYALDEKRIYERVHNTEQCMEEYREVYNKKFAELLLQEAADAITKDTRLNDVRSAANGCVRTIREHFGVEQ